MSSFTSAVLIAATTALAAGPAAAVVLTQDKAAFDTATAALSFTDESFDGFPGASGLTSFDAGPFTLDGTGGTFLILSDSSFCRSGKCALSLDLSVTISFDSPINAVGFFLGDGNGAGSSVLLDGTNAGAITTPDSGFAFVGVYDLTASFSSVRLPGSLGVFEIDDVSFATAADTAVVPVPATLPLLIAGLAGLGLAGKRRRGRA